MVTTRALILTTYYNTTIYFLFCSFNRTIRTIFAKLRGLFKVDRLLAHSFVWTCLTIRGVDYVCDEPIAEIPTYLLCAALNYVCNRKPTNISKLDDTSKMVTIPSNMIWIMPIIKHQLVAGFFPLSRFLLHSFIS